MPPQPAGPPFHEATDAHPGATIAGAPVGSLLLQVVRAHARLGSELLGEAGISPPHELVLLYLDEHGPVAQTELVRYLGRDRSTVTATLQAMERACLIARTASATDKRAMIVGLTERGAAKVPAVRAAWRELEATATGGLSDAQQKAVIRDLTAIRDRINQRLEQRRAAAGR